MIGIFGGTFDPVHFGHLRPALDVKQALGLREMRLIPCFSPPHRQQPVANPGQRLTMLRAAVGEEPELLVDNREMKREGVSYMVDTLSSLREEFGDEPLCLVLGSDAFLQLDGWHRWREIIELAHIVVTHRPGWEMNIDKAGTEIQQLWNTCHVDDAAELVKWARYYLDHEEERLAVARRGHRRVVNECGWNRRLEGLLAQLEMHLLTAAV